MKLHWEMGNMSYAHTCSIINGPRPKSTYQPSQNHLKAEEMCNVRGYLTCWQIKRLQYMSCIMHARAYLWMFTTSTFSGNSMNCSANH